MNDATNINKEFPWCCDFLHTDCFLILFALIATHPIKNPLQISALNFATFLPAILFPEALNDNAALIANYPVAFSDREGIT